MAIRYEHLLGLPFDIDNGQHCYGALRRLYKDNYNIELTDFACPTNWWNDGLNLFAKFAEEEGFSVVNSHPRDWMPGDVILMSIQSQVGNHVAVLLDDGKIFHHLYGQLSTVTQYGGMFRNNTLGVFRHKLVPQTRDEVATDLRSLLPLHVQRRLAELPDAGS